MMMPIFGRIEKKENILQNNTIYIWVFIYIIIFPLFSDNYIYYLINN